MMAAPTTPWLCLRFLGGHEIRHSGFPVILETKKSAALLAYLALDPKPHPRQKLAELLWGDLPEESARRNLRHALWDLRCRLTPLSGIAPILADAETAAFNPLTAYWLDVEEFIKMTGRYVRTGSQGWSDRVNVADLQAAVDLYGGDFLEGLYIKNAPTWEEWALVERERLRSLAMSANERLVEGYSEQGDYEAALSCAQKLLLLDPWRETAHRQLMRLLALAGQPAKALAQYETSRRILNQELGIEPAPETRQLYEQIRSGAYLQNNRWVFPSEGNLAAESDSFVGRQNELREIAILLEDPACRLITLVGPGGIGKSRLALQAGAKMAGAFTGGVYIVLLAHLNNPQEIVTALIDVFKLSLDGRQDPRSRLLDYLRALQRPLLLILDNFEHLLLATPLLSTLLAASSRLKVLVTSRSVLHLNGEYEFMLSPLAMPDLAHLPPAEALARIESVALFLERARQVRRDFILTPQNALSVASICVCLDGLPLAIELAAARSKVLAPQKLLERLKDRAGGGALRLLTGGPGDQPDRHRTQRATIEWSYNLIEAHEQCLFEKLSVFVGGFGIEAAEAVCESEGDLLEGLTSLLNKSMLRLVETSTPEPRFAMLETIREYALERLAVHRKVEKLQRRHAQYFLALAEKAELELKGKFQEDWLKRLEAEHSNLRAALQWCLNHPDHHQEVELGLRLVGALWRFWYARGNLVEGPCWLQKILSLPRVPDIDEVLRAKALHGAGVLARNQGDFDLARLFFEDSLGLYRQAGYESSVAEILGNLGAVLLDQGNYARARVFFDECLALQDRLGNQWGSALAQSNLATCLIVCQMDLPLAQALLEKSLALRRQLGDKTGIAYTLNNLGIAVMNRGDLPGAERLCGESLALFQDLGNNVGIAAVYNSLGEIVGRRGEWAKAFTYYKECLVLCQETGDKEDVAIALEGLAHVAMAKTDAQRAVRLLGAAECLREQMGLPLYPDERTRHERLVADARGCLISPVFSAAWSQGRQMGLEQALCEALEDDA